MKKSELVYNHVSLWHRQHAECVEVAIRAKEKGTRVLFLSCKGMLLACPANPYKNKKLCSKCVKQTERTESILKKYGIETCSIESERETVNFIAPESREELLGLLHDGMPIGRHVFNNLSTVLGDVFFDVTSDHAHEILSNTISLYNFVSFFIEKNQVGKVNVWNGRRSCDGTVVLAAKKYGIEHSVFITGSKDMTIKVLDGAVSVQDINHHRSKLKELYDCFDKNNDWNVAKDEASRYFNLARGVEDEVSKPYGVLVYSKSFVNSPSLFGDGGKRKLAVFVGTYLEVAGVEGFSENLNVEYGDFYEAVRRICADKEILSNYEVVVRWHPNTSRVRDIELSKLKYVAEETSSNVAHLLPADPYDSYKLLADADVVVSVGSSMAVEAAYSKKKIIFVGNNVFDGFTFPVVSKHQQLVSHLVNGFSYDMDQAYKESIVYGYYRLNRYSYVMERVRYVKRNKYRITYYLDNHLLIDTRPKWYLLRLAAYRVGFISPLKIVIGHFKSLTSRTESITL